MKSWKTTAIVGAASAAMVLATQACSSNNSGGTSPENDGGGAPDSTSGMDSGVVETSTPMDSGSGADTSMTTVDSGNPGVDSGSPSVDSGGGAMDSGSAVDSGSGVTDSGSAADSSMAVDSGSSKPDSGSVVDSGTPVEAGAWSPTSLGSSLVLWLKPSGVHTAACPQTAGTQCVTAWDDASGNGLQAKPIVAGNPPAASNFDCPVMTITSPCVSFNVPNYQGLEIASTTGSPLDLTGGYAILAIASAIGGASSPVAGGIYNRQAGTAGYPGASLWVPYLSPAYAASQGFPGSQIEYTAGDVAVWQHNLVDSNYHLFVGNYDGSSVLSMQVDNGTPILTSVPAINVSGAGQTAFIGGQTGQTFYGHMAEVLVINGPISSANLASAYAYYKALYQIP